MKIGAWIHSGGEIALDDQIVLAVKYGLQTIRCYHLGYAEKVVPTKEEMKKHLADGWRS